MIVLRKVKSQSTLIRAEDMIGTQNSVNRIFSTAQPFESGTIVLHYNGQDLFVTHDFEVVDNQTINLLHFAPHPDDPTLKATYEVAF